MEVTGAAERPSAPRYDRSGSPARCGRTRSRRCPVRPGARARVHFTPGARTAWHVHPLGQVLHVIEGVGRVQGENGPVRQIRPGDSVVIEPGEAPARRGARPPDVPRRHLGRADRLARARYRRGLPRGARLLTRQASPGLYIP